MFNSSCRSRDTSAKQRGSGWKTRPLFRAFAAAAGLGLPLLASAAQPTELFFSEYIEGGGNNKALEIYNETGASVDLSTYSVRLFSNGAAAATATLTLSGSLANGEVYVIANASAVQAILDLADITSGVTNYNGDDALTLQNGATVVDSIGQVGFDPGTAWTGGGVSTLNQTLLRKPSVCAGDGNSADAFDPSVQWNNLAQDDISDLGQHTTTCVDLAPSVASTTPADAATGVAIDASITVEFSEPVNLVAPWFTLECPGGNAIAATASGAQPGTSFVIDPDSDLPNDTTCTLTIIATQVTDDDSDDPPDAMASDHVISFDTIGLEPQLSIDDVSLAEGDAGTTLFQFTVSLTNPAAGAFTVDFATADGSAMLGDNDYQQAVGTLNFAGNDGETQTIDVLVNGDFTPEPDESFSVVLSSPSLPAVILADDTGLGTILDDDGLSIPTLQGSGFCSPLVPGCANNNNLTGPVVLTRNNVVTAVGPNIFAMQDPVGDGDPATSDGLLVFTGGAPSCDDAGMPRALQAGDVIDVEGPIVEFFGLTEIGTPNTVTCVATAALPDPVVFALDEINGDIPSRDPTALYCGDVSGQQNNFECLEGMLVEVTDGVITRGNVLRGMDTYAEVHFGPHGLRSLREPGVRFGNTLEAGNPAAGLWDGNPEMLEMDADRLDAGLSGLELVGGARFASAGILGFGFSDYEFWPVPGSFNLELASNVLPRPVRATTSPSELTVASYNMFRFCDSVAGNTTFTCLDPEPTPADVTLKAQRLSDYIRNVLRSPDVVGAQEVENLVVLQQLADQLNSDDASLAYAAFLEEGNDPGGIDVGYLVNTNRVQVDAITQLRADQTWLDPNTDPDPALLHDRPALLLEGQFLDAPNGPLAFAVMVNHFRSRGGVDNGNATGNRTRAKRFTQALAVAEEIQAFQSNPANARTPLIVIGDMNDYQFSDGYADIVGLIGGIYDDAANTCAPANGVTTCDLGGPNIVDPALLNLVDVVTAVEPNENYSFLFSENFGNIQGQARDVPTGQVLDHILVDTKIEPLTVDMAYGRANVDASQQGFSVGSGPDGAGGSQSSPGIGSSDHDGLVAYFDTDCSVQPHPGDGDGDGVCDLVDNCPLESNPGQEDGSGDGIGNACSSADLGLSALAVADEVTRDDPAAVTFTLQNIGPQAAIDATVIFTVSTISPGNPPPSVTPPKSWICTPFVSALGFATAQCSIDVFASGSAQFTVSQATATISASALLFQATASSVVDDPESFNDAAQDSVTLNHAPNIADADFTVQAGSIAGTVVGTVPATDLDDDTLAFSITAGDDGGVFLIDDNGQISVANATGLSGTFSLSIMVVDGRGGSDTATVTVSVNNAPSVDPASFTMLIGTPNGFVIGQINASDVDTDLLSYALTAGNADGAFAIDASGQLTVADSAQITADRLLTVTVDDGRGGEASATITITTEDPQDQPAIFADGFESD